MDGHRSPASKSASFQRPTAPLLHQKINQFPAAGGTTPLRRDRPFFFPLGGQRRRSPTSKFKQFLAVHGAALQPENRPVFCSQRRRCPTSSRPTQPDPVGRRRRPPTSRSTILRRPMAPLPNLKFDQFSAVSFTEPVVMDIFTRPLPPELLVVSIFTGRQPL